MANINNVENLNINKIKTIKTPIKIINNFKGLWTHANNFKGNLKKFITDWESKEKLNRNDKELILDKLLYNPFNNSIQVVSKK